MLVLFVDDDIDEFEIFCEGIKACSPQTRCLHALNGELALKMLDGHMPLMPHYIFLDINMPIMGGKEFLHRIKKLPKLNEIPVIVYSTTSNPVEMEVFRRLGAHDFVVKPATFAELIRILSRTLSSYP